MKLTHSVQTLWKLNHVRGASKYIPQAYTVKDGRAVVTPTWDFEGHTGVSTGVKGQELDSSEIMVGAIIDKGLPLQARVPCQGAAEMILLY